MADESDESHRLTLAEEEWEITFVNGLPPRIKMRPAQGWGITAPILHEIYLDHPLGA